MFRYIALVWNAADRRQLETVEQFTRQAQRLFRDWRVVLDAAAGCRVLCRGERPRSSKAYPLPLGSGVVLGKLFERSSGNEDVSRDAVLNESETQRIQASAGRRLIDEYWGRYVSFLTDDSSGTVRVLRDPTEGLPCFRTSHGSVDVFCSDIDTCERLGISKFSVNWEYVATSLALMKGGRAGQTALNEMSEVRAGECLHFQAGRSSSELYWDAAGVASTHVVSDPDHATRLLRNSVRHCVRSWASCYDGTLLRLSGGLDSAIVLACLKDHPGAARLTCLNYFSEGADSDERSYARIAARHAGRPLVELERDPKVHLEQMLTSAGTPSPSPHFLRVSVARLEAELAQKAGASAIFGGGGGDQLFFQMRAPLMAADFLYQRGLRPALFTVALDAARVDGLSVWQVLLDAFRSRWGRAREQPLPIDWPRKLILRDVVEPLLRPAEAAPDRQGGASRVPPGKLFQISTLDARDAFYDPMGQEHDPEQVRPLLSQPLIEACLRIPTYVLSAGGVYRAVARRAFEGDIPREVLLRTAKGGADDYLKAMLAFNIRFVREMLLQGALVEQGLVDARQLERALAGNDASSQAHMMEILNLFSTEVWLRRWTHRPRQAANF